MAATIRIICPKCKAQLNGPAEVAGRKVRCKGCGTTFVAAAAGAAPAAAKAPVASAKAAAAPAKGTVAPAKGGAAPIKTAPPPPQESEAFVYQFAEDQASEQSTIKPPAIKQQPQPTATPAQFDDGTNKPYDVTVTDLTPRCPYCVKEMEQGAVVCLNCGYNTQTRTKTVIKRTIATTKGDKFSWMMPGVMCVIACFLLLGLVAFLWFGISTEPDPTARVLNPGDDEKAWVRPLQIWGSIFCAFVVFFLGRFAISRLIFNPEPPEIVKE
jgi:hypothetical protein